MCFRPYKIKRDQGSDRLHPTLDGAAGAIRAQRAATAVQVIRVRERLAHRQ